MTELTELAEKIKSLLLGSGRKIAVAESLTAGQIQATIAAASGSSDYFAGGITAYNIDQKVRLLGIDRSHAHSVNCVSERVSKEMAIGVCKAFGTHIGIATTGYAEPCPHRQVEIPFAFIAIGINDQLRSLRVEIPELSRTEVQTKVAIIAIEALLEDVNSPDLQ
ncbi:MAG: CinA family protein [Planctomycetota bacterium]